MIGGRYRLAFVGDVVFNGPLERPTPERRTAFRDAVRALVPDETPIVANLEAPLTRCERAFPKKSSLRSAPEWAEALAEAGVRAVTLANNHVMDSGSDGLFETIETLDRAGIAHVGAGANLEQARRPAFLQVGGRRVALLGYTDVIVTSPVWANENEPGIAEARLEWMLEDLVAARAEADDVFVLLHWGKEGRRLPDPEQRELAAKLIAAGASAIVGHHSHTLQGAERFSTGTAIYSLGNFVFSPFDWRGENDCGEAFEQRVDFGREGQRSAAAVLSRDGEEAELKLEWIGTRRSEDGLPLASPAATRLAEGRSRALGRGYRWKLLADRARTSLEERRRRIGPLTLKRLWRYTGRKLGWTQS